ncbi:MAG TPA: DNA topoisomerase IB [Chitinophagaceae bacterium]|nr:DNA topoisomerase IB [Chitinophagaceae bacterium]
METINLPHKEMLKIHQDPVKAAKAADLRYVSDTDPGITRIKKGSGFSYMYNNKPVRDKALLERIRKLVIPPAWTNVWICYSQNGHLQATGFDVRGRKQYKYHPSWHALRNETKFHRMYEFGKALPGLRLIVEKDICEKELTERKVLATMVSLMERTYIRVGNESYEKMYGSYGLTTLKDSHVSIKGNTLSFSFKGKKGIYHNITVRSKKLAKIVQACKDISGKELFQYFDADGTRKSIDSGTLNAYIKEATGQDFTAKDFRTWAGTLAIMQVFKTVGQAASATECKKNIVAALDEVSKKLGNSRAICKKYYVHPGILRLYEESALDKHLKQLEMIEECDNKTDLTQEEKILMKILETLK